MRCIVPPVNNFAVVISYRAPPSSSKSKSSISPRLCAHVVSQSPPHRHLSSSPTAFPHLYLLLTWTAKVPRNNVVPKNPHNSRSSCAQLPWDGNVRKKKWNRHPSNRHTAPRLRSLYLQETPKQSIGHLNRLWVKINAKILSTFVKQRTYQPSHARKRSCASGFMVMEAHFWGAGEAKSSYLEVNLSRFSRKFFRKTAP
jgi:hypothetical protein